MVIKTPAKAHIGAWLYLLAYTVLGGLAVTGLLLLNKLSIVELVALWAAVSLFLGAIIHWMHFYFARFVTSMELDECWKFRTFMSERVVPWSHIGRFVLMPAHQPLSGLRVINAMLTDGLRPAIWIDNDEAEMVWRLVASKPWARAWPGMRLSSGIALVAVFLGLVSLTMGLLVAAMLLNWHLELLPRDPLPVDFRLQIMAAIGAPLLGALGVTFGVFHLVCRPIFYHPGVIRSDEAQPKTLPDMVRRFFTNSD